ncbi:MAG: phosphoribosylamine--glycine ligase, partial [Chitinophagaceae bacterium]
MRVLLLGSGGREHALAHKISQSDKNPVLYCLPGNPGIAEIAEIVDLPMDFEMIKSFIQKTEIDCLIIGPEAPLVDGIVDYFNLHLPNLKVIGPGKLAAQLEGSKSFAKAFMDKFKIPTAAYKVFNTNDLGEAIAYLDTKKAPFVLKADGLAAGKGVLICRSKEEAATELKAMLQQAKFGQAGEKVVIESFLEGIEFSVFVLTDGKNYKILPEAKDYKRAFENDEGLNTGGMGAVSPVPFVTHQLMNKVIQKIVEPTVKGIQHEKMNYKGFLY